MRWLWGLAPLVVYGALCAAAWAGQRRILFPAPAEAARIVGGAALIDVPGGTPLLWRSASTDGPVVVHFHGNAEQVASTGWLAEAYAARGVSFAAVEYPGYPLAQGEPTEAAILAAAERGLAYLTGPLGVAPERLVLSGQSLGTGVAVAMAARGWGRRLVLLSPYTSLGDVAAAAVPWLPARWLIRDRFEAARWAEAVTIPVLIVHGAKDRVIPVELGRAMAGRFARGRLVEIPLAGHNDLWATPEAVAAVFGFVEG